MSCFRFREVPVTHNIKTIIVPQVKSPYLQVHVPEDATQLIFLSAQGKISSLQRRAIQAFPDSYMPLISSMIARAAEGEIWSDDKRFFIFQSKPDKHKLKEVCIAYCRHKENTLDLCKRRKSVRFGLWGKEHSRKEHRGNGEKRIIPITCMKLI